MRLQLFFKAFLNALAPGVAALSLLDPTDPHRVAGYVTAAVVLFSGNGWLEWHTFLKPAQQVSKVRAQVLATISEPLRLKLKEQGVEVRMNLMAPYRPARWLFCRRYFRIVWSEGMQAQPDVNIRIPIGHGAVGAAFVTGEPALADATILRNGTYPFPKRLRNAVRGLTAVLSYPVYEVEDRQGIQSGKRVGVLTLDSKTADAFEKLTSAETFREVHESMRTFAAIASRLIF